MSCYAAIEADLSYKEQKDFDYAVEILTEGGWLNDKDFVIDECQNSMSEEANIDRVNRTIHIPYNLHKNLIYKLDDLVIGAEGWCVYTTTDGECQGGVYKMVDGQLKETLYDLIEWARKEISEEF